MGGLASIATRPSTARTTRQAWRSTGRRPGGPMRFRISSWMAALALVPWTVEAQYPSLPAESFRTPTNPFSVGQIDFGGRMSGVEGDPARYQRYRDLRDGAFFDLTGLHREDDRYYLDAFARNVGW